MSKVTVLIPAAGMGKRMGRAVAKQFLPLGDRPMLAHTLLAFQRASVVDEIIPILSEEDMETCLADIIEHYHITKVKTLVVGGKERQDSVYNGLQKIEMDTAIVLVHDGVRPFVTHEMIEETAELAGKGECVAVGVPLKDTVKEVGADGIVRATLDRSRLWAIQTPQAFPVKTLRRVYDESYAHKIYGTDDATLVERAGIKVRVIMGSYENIKITTSEDLLLAEEILKRR
ncbi:MAG TPA: 2-C-methyl-D-erythritol 4-phosphate cytidylyltransferase [Nitrospirota bacterium]|jgi:2-C-methyl-D-erythritol 4-phosphate cytidylyltransferase|nr:2-C-methyl-D-erythritol 4-phosphate cytidylyltransferase [Nitrospirota bacterium]